MANAPQRNVSPRGGSRRAGARRDGARRDGARQDSAPRDSARQDGARQDGARRDSARRDARHAGGTRRADRQAAEHLVQFPAGLTELVRLALADRPGWRETYADDSALLFTCRDPIRRADELPMAKAVFRVWSRTGRGSLGRALARLADTLPAAIQPQRPDPRGFRVMVQVDGALASVPPPERNRLAQALATATRQRAVPRGGNTEYWVIGRRELPELLLAEKLPRTAASPLARGALAPELAAALVLASRPAPEDRFLDPFGGSGALVRARLAFPSQRVAYGDLDVAAHEAMIADLRRDPRVRIGSDDALVLPSVADGSVDVVVTDPPWGEHEPTVPPYPEFAERLGVSLRRVLTAEGRLVLLIARRRADQTARALASAGFTLADPIEVLVNGHPASVLTGSS